MRRSMSFGSGDRQRRLGAFAVAGSGAVFLADGATSWPGLDSAYLLFWGGLLLCLSAAELLKGRVRVRGITTAQVRYLGSAKAPLFAAYLTGSASLGLLGGYLAFQAQDLRHTLVFGGMAASLLVGIALLVWRRSADEDR